MLPLSIETALWALAAYGLASISTAVVVCRVLRLPDPRTEGSRNAGATNVLRLGGKLAGLITLTGDVAKGVVPVLLCSQLDKPHYMVAAAGVAAVAGHIYPVWHDFRGGKGVATGLGVLTVWHWPSALAFCVAWASTAALTRFSSLASMMGCLAAAVWSVVFTVAWGEPSMMLAALILFRHQPNLRNIREGREPRLGERRSVR
jgi:glycerol-3-phosphate acyltransferase PlsY